VSFVGESLAEAQRREDTASLRLGVFARETVTISLAVWALVTIGFTAHVYLTVTLSGRTFTWGHGLVRGAAFSTIWAALAPVVFWASRRFRLERGRLAGRVAVHLALSLALAVVQSALRAVVIPLADPGAGDFPEYGVVFWQAFLTTAHLSVITYWAIVALVHSLDSRRELAERERRGLQLEALLARSELDVLRAQLQPHFLFNTLNTISGLVHEDPHAADRMVARLSDMLRIALDRSGEREVSLRDELELLAPYLEIQQIRFSDRLDVRVDVEPDALDALVPSLVLQPLVENAVRHGVAPLARGGTVVVAARREGDRLEVEVSDTGRGLADGYREGIGLANARALLAHASGGAATFAIERGPDGGTVARISTPFRRAMLPVEAAR
jgi:two-component system, LytTR family, sensor kinase